MSAYPFAPLAPDFEALRVTPAWGNAIQVAALNFGYRLTLLDEPGRGLVWYAIPPDGRPLCIGSNRELERFVANHKKWSGLPSGAARIERWRAQKLRAAIRRRWVPSVHLAEARLGR